MFNLKLKCEPVLRTGPLQPCTVTGAFRDAGDASGTDCVCYVHQPATRTHVDASGVIQQATPVCVPREHAPATQAEKSHPTRSASQGLGGCRPAPLPKGLQTGSAPSGDSPTHSASHPESRTRRLQAGPSQQQALPYQETPRPIPLRPLSLGLGDCSPDPPPKGLQTRTGTAPSGDSPTRSASHLICFKQTLDGN